MTTVQASRPSLRRRLGLGNRGGLAGYIFVAPSLVFLIVFVIFPIVAAGLSSPGTMLYDFVSRANPLRGLVEFCPLESTRCLGPVCMGQGRVVLSWCWR